MKPQTNISHFSGESASANRRRPHACISTAEHWQAKHGSQWQQREKESQRAHEGKITLLTRQVELGIYLVCVCIGLMMAASAMALEPIQLESQEPSPLRGEFSTTQIEPMVFEVSFIGSSGTTNEQVADMAMLRAAEVTLQEGAQYFEIIESTQEDIHRSIDNGYNPEPINTYSMVQNVEGVGTVVTQETISNPAAGGQVNSFIQPSAIFVIRLHQTQPADVTTYDARQIYKEVTETY
ncbi:MAG: hypothetical protein SVC26_03805 [Pseudomonadota bacterium]|nr:hypothetical protein [Pseudomonadota bacterium]